jgi:hypothetical protein
MGATPQLPRDDLVKWMKGIESQISLLHERMNNPLANTGLSVPGAGTTQVDGNLVILGNLTANGKITNSALVTPPTYGAGGNNPIGFAITTAGSEIATVTFPVPAGYGYAKVTVLANASAHNPTASTDFMYVSARITVMPGGAVIPGGEAFVEVSAGNWGTVAASLCSGVLIPVGTTSLVASCHVRTGTAGWALNASNAANADAEITYAA